MAKKIIEYDWKNVFDFQVSFCCTNIHQEAAPCDEHLHIIRTAQFATVWGLRLLYT